MLVLHHGDTSVASSKVRLVLAEKRLDFESHLYDLRRGEHRNPAYLKINPRGVVPTLVDDGVVVPESNVILEYLEETFFETAMLPRSAAARVPVRLMLREVDHLHEACSVLSSSLKLAKLRIARRHEWDLFLSRVADSEKRDRQRQLLEFGFDAPVIRTAVQSYRQIVQLADGMLRDSKWLSGSSVGLADCAALPYFHRADSLGLKELWTSSQLCRAMARTDEGQTEFRDSDPALDRNVQSLSCLRRTARDCFERLSFAAAGLVGDVRQLTWIATAHHHATVRPWRQEGQAAATCRSAKPAP